MTSDTAVSVVIACHDERRFDLLAAVVEAARRQSTRPAEIVVVVDHNERLYARAARELHATVLRNCHRRGVSGNRNTGARHTTSPLVAFLDDDVVVAADWLARLVEPLHDPRVIGTGGAIEPLWTRAPWWLPPEFLWAFGASYTGLPTSTSPVRNVWSASMVVRRGVFEAVGGFRTDFGKVGDRSRPEDTELCIRMSAATGGRWVYVPDAVIGHHVPPRARTLRYLMTRSYHEGRGKIAMASLERAGATGSGLGAEEVYLRHTLPRAAVREARQAVRRRDPRAAARVAVILGGVAVAGLGGAVELLGQVRSGTARGGPRRPHERQERAGRVPG